MHRSIIAAVAWASLAGACGGDDALTVDGLIPYVIDTQCAVAVECQQIVDEATCKGALLLNDQESLTIIADIKAGIIKFDGTKAKQCFDAQRDAGCTFTGTHAADNDPCSTYLTGTVAAGGACFEDFECLNNAACNPTDTNCDPSAACCPGTCATATAPAEVALGGACMDVSECPVNGYCKGATQTAPGVCTAVQTTAGAACDDIFACANNMICSSSTAGTCYNPGAEGATCDPMFFISNFACSDERDFCDPATMKCVKAIAVGGTCSDTLPCVGFAECIATKCVAQPKVGEACDDANGASCVGNASCTNSICTNDPAGTSCR